MMNDEIYKQIVRGKTELLDELDKGDLANLIERLVEAEPDIEFTGHNVNRNFKKAYDKAKMLMEND